MEKQPRSSILYRFGPYEVDVAAGQLRKQGRKLRLTGQPLELLILLLERAGEVVTREEIERRLWSGETFVDFENGLNKAINRLRQTVNDSSVEPHYIETLPRRGYRFMAPVRQEEFKPAGITVTSTPPLQATETGASSKPPAPAPVLQRPSVYWMGAAAMVFLLAGGLVFWPVAVPRVGKVSPLTITGRADSFGRLQTDGVRLFFLQRRGHQWQNTQMPVAGGAIQPLTDPFPNAKVLAVSPDASEFLIAPFESRERSLPVWIMPSVGGTPRRLGNVLATDATFTPDGAMVTFLTDEGIFLIDREGSNPRKFVDAKGVKSSLAWSPDGKELRFAWQTTPQGVLQLWSVDTVGKHLRLLLPGWKEAPGQCCGRYSRDGELYVFVGFLTNGTRSLFLRREKQGLFAARGQPVRLDTGPIQMEEPAFGAEPHKIFALGNTSRSEYVRFDPGSQQFHSVLGGEQAVWLNISRDMVWAVYRGSSNKLWISKTDGSERRQLTDGRSSAELPVFRPDSKEIVFGVTPFDSTITKICAASIDGGALRDIVTEKYSVYAPSWSPDGAQLVYAVDPEENAEAGLYILDWASQRRTKIPESEGYWKTRWSPDGRLISAISFDSKRIGLFDTRTQKWTKLASGNVLSPVAWSADSRFIFYQDLIEPEQPVHRLNIQTREIAVALECKTLLEGGVLRCGFEDVLEDGSLLVQLARGDHDVFAIELDRH